jgi:adenine-specific DNA-methyltransferase
MNIESNSYDELKEYYNNYLNKKKSLMKTSNDICTPIECIEEMVSKIDINFWKKKDIKILDPCCGSGNFFLVILNLLTKYNEQERTFILKNVLHFNDINIERLQEVENIFGITNITQKNFLVDFESTIKYDLIVANPPYAKFTCNGKRASKNHNFITSFLEKSFELLKPDGLLLYIIPDNWMSYSNRNKLIKKITSKQIIHLDIHISKKYFKSVGSSFTWFLLENKKYYKDFTISGIWKNILYNDVIKSEIRNFIPLYYNSIVQSILHKTLDNNSLKKFNIETSSYLHRTTKKDYISNVKDDLFRYKLIHTSKQIVYSNKPHKFQDGYKVFINLTGYYKIFIDNCGMTQSIAFIRCKNYKEAENILEILSHPLYVFLNNICRYGNFNNVKVLQSFPICKEYYKVYHELDITQKEINIIEK